MNIQTVRQEGKKETHKTVPVNRVVRSQFKKRSIAPMFAKPTCVERGSCEKGGKRNRQRVRDAHSMPRASRITKKSLTYVGGFVYPWITSFLSCSAACYR